MADKELNALIDTVAKSKAPNEKKVEQIREQIKMREMVRLRRDQVGIGMGSDIEFVVRNCIFPK